MYKICGLTVSMRHTYSASMELSGSQKQHRKVPFFLSIVTLKRVGVLKTGRHLLKTIEGQSVEQQDTTYHIGPVRVQSFSLFQSNLFA